MIRSLHFSDFLKLGRLHQAEVGLNLPNSLVEPASPLTAALIQNLPVNSLSSSVYIYEEDKLPLAFIQARARSRKEEWDIMALGMFGDWPADFQISSDNSDEATEAEESTEIIEIALPSSDGAEPEYASPPITPLQKLEELDRIETERQSQEGEQEGETWVGDKLPFDLVHAWLELLEHLIVDIGERGAQRLFARLALESSELSLFRRLGFHTYTRESLYRYDHTAPVEKPVGLNVKRQRSGDLWAVDRLYHTITPTTVRDAEQSNSESWEVSRSHFPRSTKESGWVVNNDELGRLSAYVRVMSYRNKHLIRIMNLEEQRHLLPDIIRYALSNLKCGPDVQVFASVREYQAEQEAVLEEAGFTQIGRQAVLVKHTVNFVRATERALVHAAKGRLELARSAAQPNLVAHSSSQPPEL